MAGVRQHIGGNGDQREVRRCRWYGSDRNRRYRRLMQAANDGDAVATARAALPACWRSTVVPHKDGGWVVRTWTTTTPPTENRPSGTPDFVHRVEARPGLGKLKAEQIHPRQEG